jgi:hypothetical protein
VGSTASAALASCACLALGCLAIASLALAAPVVAHSGNARLELGDETVPAGSILEVRVFELWPNEPVEIVLIEPGGRERSLGSATGDEVGSFTTAVTVPADASPGLYLVTVYAPDGHPLQWPLVIAELVGPPTQQPLPGLMGGASGLLPAVLILGAFCVVLLVVSAGRRRYR